MSRNALLADIAVAVVLAVLVIVISPGLAVVGLLALLVVVVCVLSVGIDRLRHRPADPASDLQPSQERAARRAQRSAQRAGRRSPQRRQHRP